MTWRKEKMINPSGSSERKTARIIRWGGIGILFVLASGRAEAVITGVCSSCHTMHNSQNGAPMTFDLSSNPVEGLTRGDCLGCHAQNSAQARLNLGADLLPQVMHTASTDLAGGNFAYITGDKGSGASDTKGHNIAALTGEDSILSAPPGGIVQSFHDSGGNVNTSNLSCSGANGCHGVRLSGGRNDSPLNGITGAHHKNVDGQLDTADSMGTSYRFLFGVKGLESSDWEHNATASSHNEYFALSTPGRLGCGRGATSCHIGPVGDNVVPPDGTMSQFCATCHGNFHTLETGDSEGIGEEATSPFIRHPTDLTLPASGEYAFYNPNNGNLYSLEAPVARTGGVPETSSETVTPGSDAVMCLSCHRAHATDYPDMLRWDYDQMIAGGGGNDGTGCFVCHTAKDDSH